MVTLNKLFLKNPPLLRHPLPPPLSIHSSLSLCGMLWSLLQLSNAHYASDMHGHHRPAHGQLAPSAILRLRPLPRSLHPSPVTNRIVPTASITYSIFWTGATPTPTCAPSWIPLLLFSRGSAPALPSPLSSNSSTMWQHGSEGVVISCQEKRKMGRERERKWTGRNVERKIKEGEGWRLDLHGNQMKELPNLIKKMKLPRWK